MEPNPLPTAEMTITPRLSPEEERKLLERATESGQDVPSHVRHLIQCHISKPMSLSEILAPVREDFRRSGMTEDELASLIEKVRDEVWEEKQRGKSSE
jgi:hypothetical protein